MILFWCNKDGETLTLCVVTVYFSLCASNFPVPQFLSSLPWDLNSDSLQRTENSFFFLYITSVLCVFVTLSSYMWSSHSDSVTLYDPPHPTVNLPIPSTISVQFLLPWVSQSLCDRRISPETTPISKTWKRMTVDLVWTTSPCQFRVHTFLLNLFD